MRNRFATPSRSGVALARIALFAGGCFPGLVWADTSILPTLPPTPPGMVTSAVTLQSIGLAEARELALKKQPALTAARLGVTAAQAKVRGLNELPRLAGVLRKDLPVRCQQAGIGIKAAEARVRQAEIETRYSVTRLYWSVVHAKAQLRLLDETLEEPPSDWKKPKDIENLTKLLYIQKFAKGLEMETLDRDSGRWGINQFDVMVEVLRQRREEAKSGVRRALVALAEAIGLEPGTLIDVADNELPGVQNEPSKQQVTDLALEKRAELEQLALAIQVTDLEAEAQGLIHGSRGETFATGSDLHAQPLQTFGFGEEYRPAAVGVEMPATLVGPACVRQEQARIYAGRTQAALDKARGLIALDAQNTYLQWQEQASQLSHAELAAGRSRESIKKILTDLSDPDSKARVSELLITIQTRAQLLAEVNRLRFQKLLHFVSLERATGGGFCPTYGPAIATVAPPLREVPDSKDTDSKKEESPKKDEKKNEDSKKETDQLPEKKVSPQEKPDSGSTPR